MEQNVLYVNWLPSQINANVCVPDVWKRHLISIFTFFLIPTHNKVLSRTDFLNLLLQSSAMHIKYLISGISHFTLSTLKRACAVQFFTFSHAQRTRSVKVLAKRISLPWRLLFSLSFQLTFCFFLSFTEHVEQRCFCLEKESLSFWCSVYENKCLWRSINLSPMWN